MTRTEFNEFCDQLHQDGHLTTDQTAKFKELGHIPLIYRGEDTEFIFTKFHITGSLATIVIEGSIVNRTTYVPLAETN